MNATKFWEMIELAWRADQDAFNLRERALATQSEMLFRTLARIISGSIIANITKQLMALEQNELTKFIHVLEDKLFHIDREDIHEYTGGSDEGFLFSRCFIVGMGEIYYNRIDNNPSMATMYATVGALSSVAYEVYEYRFGEHFERNSIHCIESGSNSRCW